MRLTATDFQDIPKCGQFKPRLRILSGASFDRSFAKSMVKDHQEDNKECRQEATKNDAAGRLAKETLPVLQKHLQAAQAREKQTAQKQSSR